MKPEPFSIEKKIGDEVFRFESGRVAGLANGAVLASVGDTMVLATATSSAPRGDADFFPLTIDVEERMYAAGKIPGGFFRREGRATEKAILNARLIDRPLRPSFPDGFRNEVHVVVTVLSVDESNPVDILAVNAASAAVAVSDIPFDRAVGCVRLSHINGDWVANPTWEEMEDSTIELVVAGRKNESGEVDIMMIEAGGSDNLVELIDAGAPAPTEEVLAEGIEVSKNYIAEMIEAQDELVKGAGKPKASMGDATSEYPTLTDYQDDVLARVRELGQDAISKATAIQDKKERRTQLKDIEVDIMARLGEEFAEREREVKAAIRAVVKKVVRHRIIEEGVRLDGRGTARCASDLDTSGCRPAGPWFRTLHPWRDSSALSDDARHAADGADDRRSLSLRAQALHASLQLPAVLDRRGRLHAGPEATRDRPRRSCREGIASDDPLERGFPLRGSRRV